MDKAGQLYNVFTDEEVEYWVKVLKTTDPVNVMGNQCFGVDEKNVTYYPWFLKNVFSKIQHLFGQDLILLFGMFLIENRPWKIHTDAYHVKTRPGTRPAYSFLIPYSVNFDKTLVTQSQTIVFNESVSDNAEIVLLPSRAAESNCGLSIYQLLNHNASAIVEKTTIKQQCHWQPGSLIYWDSCLLHDTDNFLNNGYTSKQAIVIHTAYQL